mmetsp:Transcript_87975/g.247199  ORF Transcript_87975/g.247199 Transcript_87975/m.247199 type:complete len:190 (-) Transcript_87975:140-709(-)
MPAGKEAVYLGTVKSYNPDKGWGHIECPDTEAVYGKDIFFLRTSLQFARIAKGCRVLFNVAQGEKGPQAADVKLAPQAEETEVYTGEIKSWNLHKGWGFIECSETFELYGKDIFVMRSAVYRGEACKGERVSFSITMGDRGPEALNVQTIDGGHGLAKSSFGRQAGRMALGNIVRRRSNVVRGAWVMPY